MPVKPVPDGYSTVTPYLSIKGAADALEFYKKGFGATEILRMMGSDGQVGHAEIQIGDSRIMMADECPQAGGKSPKTLGGTSVGILLYVEDVDAFIARALAAGATQTAPIEDKFYGDRMGGLTDPFGHSWHVATHTEDVAPAEIERRLKAMTTTTG
jgi:PhnB protein